MCWENRLLCINWLVSCQIKFLFNQVGLLSLGYLINQKRSFLYKMVSWLVIWHSNDVCSYIHVCCSLVKMQS